MSNLDEYYNIITAEDLANNHLKESVFDFGDIGHPSKSTIAYDVDIDLERRNGMTKEEDDITVSENYISREEFIQKHIDMVKSEFGEDLELLPTDVNLIYRSIISDPDYDSYDIMKDDIKDYLKKHLNEEYEKEQKVSEKSKAKKDETFEYTMNMFGTGDLKTSNGTVVVDKNKALSIAYGVSGLNEKDAQKSIMGYIYDDLKPMISTINEQRFIRIRKNNVLIEGEVVEYTNRNIMFEHKNIRYNIEK